MRRMCTDDYALESKVDVARAWKGFREHKDNEIVVEKAQVNPSRVGSGVIKKQCATHFRLRLILARLVFSDANIIF